LHDTHTGVDLYCDLGTEVFAVEGGKVVSVERFTGDAAGSPWWLETWAVLVEGASGVVVYGELEKPSVAEGDHVVAGARVGKVARVLIKDKGRPMSMLHLELYAAGTTRTKWWRYERPADLVDPTPYLLEAEMGTERRSCTTSNYDSLYARWLEKPGALLDWGGYNPAKHNLLDLCGGTGAVSLAARTRGGTATLLDLRPRCPDEEVIPIQGRAENLNLLASGRTWNFVVCRQSLGYLNLPRVAQTLYGATTPGALFVCNNFQKPKWSLRPYLYRGKWYVEASGYLGKKVFHLQATGDDYDITTFRWHTPEEVQEAFSTAGWMLVRQELGEKSAKFCFQRKP
jgi:ubiquinone/menaquinone biosynthesis C-methylase UbiE